MSTDGEVPNGVETLRKINCNRLSRVHERYRQRYRVDRRQHIAKTILDFNEARDDGVAVASAGSYANHLHLAPEG